MPSSATGRKVGAVDACCVLWQCPVIRAIMHQSQYEVLACYCRVIDNSLEEWWQPDISLLSRLLQRCWDLTELKRAFKSPASIQTGQANEQISLCILNSSVSPRLDGRTAPNVTERQLSEYVAIRLNRSEDKSFTVASTHVDEQV